MSEDTDFESNEPLSVEKRAEMFFIPGYVATQADNQFNDQNDDNDDDIGNGFRNSCKCANHCLDNFILQDIAEHIYNIRELEKAEKELLIMSSLPLTSESALLEPMCVTFAKKEEAVGDA